MPAYLPALEHACERKKQAKQRSSMKLFKNHKRATKKALWVPRHGYSCLRPSLIPQRRVYDKHPTKAKNKLTDAQSTKS